MNSYEKRWEPIRSLGSGGQGTVTLVRDKSKYNVVDVKNTLRKSVRELSSSIVSERQNEAFEDLHAALAKMASANAPANLGALKQLHAANDARDPERAKERIARELKAMAEADHPNLLRIVDSDPSSEWFVSEYHPGGTLYDNMKLTMGDVEGSLELIRPLVSAVQYLHNQGVIHRDIKPHNIFIGSQRQLVLGDFGLVYFSDDQHTRLSGTLENVGTRDWMPAWAMGMRFEDVRPTFDVFSLGKVLWSLVSGKSFLQLWYFDRAANDLALQFPSSPYMPLVNRLLRRCVVETEDACLPNAESLLAEIDNALVAIRGRAGVFPGVQRRKCLVCAVGEYKELSQHEINNSGLGRPSGERKQKIFACNACGHVQQFLHPSAKSLPLWDFVV